MEQGNPSHSHSLQYVTAMQQLKGTNAEARETKVA